MLNSFSRTELLLGRDAMERLSKARVAIFGIGGVGGYAVEALARSGVGTLDLIDDDKVCLTNINRQIIATTSTVGKYRLMLLRNASNPSTHMRLSTPTRHSTCRIPRRNLIFPSMTM